MIISNKKWVWVIGLGLAFSAATQLRFLYGVFGPGEALLLVAIVCGLIQQIRYPSFGMLSELYPFLLFWLVSIVLLGGGYWFASHHYLEAYNLTRDVFAYLFIISFLVIVILKINRSHAEQVLIVLAVTGTLCLTCLFIVSCFIPSAYGIDFWLSNRFKGWAENPNQLALYFSSLPFLLLYLVRDSIEVFKKGLCICALALCVLLGVMVRSDALYLSWIVGFSLLIVSYVVKALSAQGGGSFSRLDKRLMVAIISFVTIASYALFYEDAFRFAYAIYSENNQGAVRFGIWENAITVIQESPLVGWGPGAHSGIRVPHDNFEAHNIILDWGTNTGLIGIVTMLLMLFWIIRSVFKSGSWLLLVSVVAVLVISMFHHYLRHPLFWFYLVLPTILAIDTDHAPVCVSGRCR